MACQAIEMGYLSLKIATLSHKQVETLGNTALGIAIIIIIAIRFYTRQGTKML
jgi:hypothetical protein